jgi:hypothetical protein
VYNHHDTPSIEVINILQLVFYTILTAASIFAGDSTLGLDSIEITDNKIVSTV